MPAGRGFVAPLVHEGLVKTYAPPFTANRHDALDQGDYIMANTTATLDEMIAAQERVRDFMARSEESIDCLDEASKEGALTDDQRSLIIRAHNDTVDVMEEIAGTFNAQIGIFRERE